MKLVFSIYIIVFFCCKYIHKTGTTSLTRNIQFCSRYILQHCTHIQRLNHFLLGGKGTSFGHLEIGGKHTATLPPCIYCIYYMYFTCSFVGSTMAVSIPGTRPSSRTVRFIKHYRYPVNKCTDFRQGFMKWALPKLIHQ